MKKKIGNRAVSKYERDGVFNIGDLLFFDAVRDHEDPRVVHKGVYGEVVDILSAQDHDGIVVSFAEMVDENGERDPGRALRRFLSAAPAE